MNHVRPESIEIDELLGLVAAEYFELCASGKQPTIDELAARYPDIADHIRRTFPALAVVGQTTVPPDERSHGPTSTNEQIGDFRIISEIGRGGMGVVYEAEQLSIGRRVALKVLPFAALAGDRALQRFRNEVRAATSLDHPHIVTVYSVGEERGIHYFAMRLIKGYSLLEVLADVRQQRDTSSQDGDSAALSTSVPLRSGTEYYKRVATLGRQAAEAIHFAHENGVIHRDLKPANLMIDTFGNLYVADFGLARIESDAGLTMTGDFLGTLRYMSPEQAATANSIVDHRTDVYGLGVTLYEFCTLRPAFEGDNRADLLRRVVAEQPLALSKALSDIPRDLETIIQKAMSKDADDRYATAADLAADLERFINVRPILAKRPTLAEKGSKLVRRHPKLSGTLLLLTLAASILLGVSYSVAVNNAKVAAERAEQESSEAYQMRMQACFVDFTQGNTAQVRAALDDLTPSGDDKDRRGIEWYVLDDLLTDRVVEGPWQEGERVQQVVYSERAKLIVVATNKAGLYVLDEGLNLKKQLRAPDGPTFDRHSDFVSLDPNGRYLYSAAGRQPGFERCDLNSDEFPVEVLGTQLGRSAEVLSASADGRVAVGMATPKEKERFGMVTIWDAESGQYVAENEKGSATSLAWSPDGKYLARAGWYSVTLYLAETMEVVGDFKHDKCSCNVRFSPDGKFLVSGAGGDLVLVNVSVSPPVRCPPTEVESPWAFSFVGDDRFVTGSASGVLRYWRIGRYLDTFRAKVESKRNYGTPIRTVATGRGSDQLVMGGLRELIIPRTEGDAFKAYAGWMNTIGVQGERVALVSKPDDHLIEMNLANGSHRTIVETAANPGDPGSDVTCVSYTPDGQRIGVISRGSSSVFSVWSRTGKLESRFEIGAIRHVFINDELVFSFHNASASARLWDWRKREIVAESAPARGYEKGWSTTALARWGNMVASGHGKLNAGGMVCLWELKGTQITLKRQIPAFSAVEDIRFSPAGDWLAAGDAGGVMLCPSGPHGDVRHLPAGDVRSVDISPDGRRLVNIDQNIIRFWDFETARSLGAVNLDRFLTCVRFVGNAKIVYVPQDVGVKTLGR